MKRDIAIFKHPRGNHGVGQIMYHGREYFRGTATEARKELIKLRKIAREVYNETSTEDSVSEFVDDWMSEYFAVDMDKQWWFIA